MGRVRRAHGLRGELAVELLTDAPEVLFAPGHELYAGTADGDLWLHPKTAAVQPLVVTASRPFKDGLLVTFDAIGDRTEAERWNGRHLLAPLGDLAPPAEGEVYVHELDGMRVLDTAGAEIGTVCAWYRVPNGILLDLQTARGVRAVPYHAAFVRGVDRAGRSLVMELPEGLLE